jgi:hypothetical protein
MEVLMKAFVVILLSFVLACAMIPGAWAQGATKEPKVYCCHVKGHSHGAGKCDKMHTKTECEKEGGKVVNDCKECKDR